MRLIAIRAAPSVARLDERAMAPSLLSVLLSVPVLLLPSLVLSSLVFPSDELGIVPKRGVPSLLSVTAETELAAW